jgi:hypothetical protein
MALASRTEAGRERFEMLARKWLALATDYDAAKLLLTNWGGLPVQQDSAAIRKRRCATPISKI